MAYTSSSFSRTRENEAKMGAYYTDVSHCNDIRKLLIFPEEKEVCVLEPCIGDGKAVVACTGADKNPNIKIFGVELNDSVASQTKKENPFLTELIKADFTDGVAIRKNCFSFAFGNPPYLSEKNEVEGTNVRMERVFLDKIVNYLKIGAVLVWVIPYHTFCDTSYIRMWMRDFDTEAIYKFREPEYSKYHQIVIVGRKVRRRVNLVSQIEEYIRHWNLSNLADLPLNPEPCIEVFSSEESEIDVFTTRAFDQFAAFEFLKPGVSDDIKCAFDKRASQKPYSGGKLGRPPITPKKDSKYLLVTSGFSDGVVGSEEESNIHMMRGIAAVVERAHYNVDDEDEENESGTVTVTTRTEVEMRVVENDGTIRLLT